jgi:hypothetical protein
LWATLKTLEDRGDDGTDLCAICLEKAEDADRKISELLEQKRTEESEDIQLERKRVWKTSLLARRDKCEEERQDIDSKIATLHEQREKADERWAGLQNQVDEADESIKALMGKLAGNEAQPLRATGAQPTNTVLGGFTDLSDEERKFLEETLLQARQAKAGEQAARHQANRQQAADASAEARCAAETQRLATTARAEGVAEAAPPILSDGHKVAADLLAAADRIQVQHQASEAAAAQKEADEARAAAKGKGAGSGKGARDAAAPYPSKQAGSV